MYFKGDWFLFVLTVVTAMIMSKPYVYVIQQDNYRLKGVFKSKSLRSFYLADLGCVLIYSAIFAGLYTLRVDAKWTNLVTVFFFITIMLLYVIFDGEKKKPLRYTKRAVRGTVITSSVFSAVVILSYTFLADLFYNAYGELKNAIFIVFPIFYPLGFTILMTVVNVFERLNNLRYENKAKKALSNTNAVKIAITGSYGKTSVKCFLKELLSIKYTVLATPASYNTPMGIAKTAKDLDLSYDVFVAEMGARRKGDIARLMHIVKPQMGVLIGLNCQHLETFKSEKNIAVEKMHIVDMLDKDGFCVVNQSVLYNKFADFSKHKDKQIVFAGKEGEVYFSDPIVYDDGTRFKLHFGNNTYDAFTQLLGTHNLENLALASAVAHRMGVAEELIVEKIARIEPVEHRLQLIKANGVKIVDDTFNSNPDGAKIALDVLASFQGRKVVVTPGLVELGEREEFENVALGEQVALIADVVVLVGGKRADYINHGLGNFDGEIYRFDTLAQAQKSFKDFIKQGDVVLLLNDLPDIYED
jgi:UDP-N-acetylmuramoyl-tripeptide--D-alanyl-D-alanine ligase